MTAQQAIVRDASGTVAFQKITIQRLEAELLAARKALAGIFSYACTGAAVSDVDTYEQPQFVEARAILVRLINASPES